MIRPNPLHSLLADTRKDILDLLARFETSSDISLSPTAATEAMNMFREEVRKHPESILSLYLLDVYRSGLDRGVYRVVVRKELSLVKDFSTILSVPLRNPPPRDLTPEEIAQRYPDEERRGSQEHEHR